MSLRAVPSSTETQDTPCSQCPRCPRCPRCLLEAANQELPRPLTPRELQVLTMVSRGLSNPQVARDLHLSPATVKTHVSRILAKLRAGSRTEAAVEAVHAGLLPERGPAGVRKYPGRAS